MAVVLVFGVCLSAMAIECDLENFSGFDTPPTMKSIYTPLSDQTLLLNEISGRVELRALVRADRSLCDLEVISSNSDEMLAVCRGVVEQARFSTARLGKSSVDGHTEMVFWIERSVYDRVVHDHEGAGFDENAPFVGDLAGVEEYQLYSGLVERVFVYEGVAFIGDISTRRYLLLQTMFQNKFGAEEEFSEIRTTRIAAGDHRIKERYTLEYLVVTKIVHEDGSWIPGRKFRCTYDGCTFMMLPALGWHDDP